jgi:hypothetical protein
LCTRTFSNHRPKRESAREREREINIFRIYGIEKHTLEAHSHVSQIGLLTVPHSVVQTLPFRRGQFEVGGERLALSVSQPASVYGNCLLFCFVRQRMIFTELKLNNVTRVMTLIYTWNNNNKVKWNITHRFCVDLDLNLVSLAQWNYVQTTVQLGDNNMLDYRHWF